MIPFLLFFMVLLPLCQAAFRSAFPFPLLFSRRRFQETRDGGKCDRGRRQKAENRKQTERSEITRFALPGESLQTGHFFCFLFSRISPRSVPHFRQAAPLRSLTVRLNWMGSMPRVH